MKTKLVPLEQWICDKCGNLIESAEAGYLEWLDDADHRAHSFKIVHGPYGPGKNCYHYTDATIHDFGSMQLDTYVGANGMAELLAFLDPGTLIEPKFDGPEVVNVREWVELVRRLHLKHYEEARLSWNEAKDDGHFEGANQVSPYTQASLRGIIERYGQ